jgi:enoyl-[acyl-carrier protein] reductase I
MSKLLEGRTALILGIANRWSLAYAIAQAFHREGASLALTYLREKQKQTIEELAADWNVCGLFPCDVSKDEEIEALGQSLAGLNRPLHAVVHSLAFANPEDLSRPFLETSRAGFTLAQDISAYSLVAIARMAAPLMTEGGSISTLSYLGSVRVVTNYNVMGTAKASLESSVRYLASELGEKKIRVNAISAGPVKTASARGKGFFDDPQCDRDAEPATAERGAGGGRGFGCVPGERYGARRDGQRFICRFWYAGDGVLNEGRSSPHRG